MADVNGIWKCSFCGVENSGNFCCECGSAKPGYVPGNNGEPNTSGNAPISSDADNTWICRICGHKNTQNACSFCGQSQQANENISVPEQVPFQPSVLPANWNLPPVRGMLCVEQNETVSDEKSVEPWTCTNCEHTNKGGTYCFNCGKPNPALKNDKEWICPDCRTTVPNTSPFCHECGKRNPFITNREASAKAGHDVNEPWKCLNCGFENSSGLYCEKCDAAKPPENSTFSGYLALNPQESTQQQIQPAFGLASLPDFIELEQMRRFHNKLLKTEPGSCGCYTCSKVFESSEITTWNGDIAVCPYCQSETVIVKPEKDINFAEILDKMNRFHIKHESVDGWKKSKK